MQDFSTILQNQLLLVSLIACFTAQGLKVIIELIRNGKVNFRFLVTTGGMPSAHSALVGSLATAVGLTLGWSSPEFAIAALFAVIVMYDAAGVRQAAGKQARILNKMLDEHNDNLDTVLPEFSKLRKPDADAILELALRNYIEMRDLTGDPEFLLQKKIEARFSKKYPEKWIPLYSQVTFSDIPYHQALANGDRQQVIMSEIMKMDNIEEMWDSEVVEKRILEMI
jgi:acid phosphatase family membrane protein YuiD